MNIDLKYIGYFNTIANTASLMAKLVFSITTLFVFSAIISMVSYEGYYLYLNIDGIYEPTFYYGVFAFIGLLLFVCGSFCIFKSTIFAIEFNTPARIFSKFIMFSVGCFSIILATNLIMLDVVGFSELYSVPVINGVPGLLDSSVILLKIYMVFSFTIPTILALYRYNKDFQSSGADNEN